LHPSEPLEADQPAPVRQRRVRDQLAEPEHLLERRQPRGRHLVGRPQQRHADVLPVRSYKVDELQVARLEHVERQDHPRQQHDVRQREHRQRREHLRGGYGVDLEHLSPL
jgi:hypothetical protein